MIFPRAAWTAIGAMAEEQGFEFRVPKNQARNPKNLPTRDEEVTLKYFDQNKSADEYLMKPCTLEGLESKLSLLGINPV